MQRRRRFLGTVGSLTIPGLAGCLSEDSDDGPVEQSDDGTVEQSDDTRKTDTPSDGGDTPSSANQDGSNLEDAGPAETLEEFLRTQVEVLTTEQQFYHNVSRSGEFELLSLETETVEEDVDLDTIAEQIHLEKGELDTALADEERALVEADIEIKQSGERVQNTDEWYLATEDGQWRILQQVQEVETGTEDTEQVADNVNVIAEVGTVGVHGADDGQIGELRLGLQPATGADEVNLADLTLQYVSDGGSANIVVGSDGGEPATAETSPADIEIDGTAENQYDVEVVTAENEDDLVMSDNADRYELVIPLSDDQESLAPLDEEESAEITITTAAGAQTVAFLQVPASLSSKEDGENVTL